MPESIDPRRVEELRRMTPAQKLEMVAALYRAEIERRTAHLRSAHPDWSEERLDREARRAFLLEGT